MSTITDRLATVYARSSTPSLCTALDRVAESEGEAYRQVCTWLIDELIRRSPEADAASLRLCDGDEPVSQPQLARTVAHAARADTEARGA